MISTITHQQSLFDIVFKVYTVCCEKVGMGICTLYTSASIYIHINDDCY